MLPPHFYAGLSMLPDLKKPCKLSTYAPNGSGYAHCFVRGVRIKHHRQAYCEANEVSIESISGLQVRHLCDVKNCIEPEHLMLGTNEDNIRDRFRWDRKDGTSKLTASQAKEIRSRMRDSGKELAAEFGVSKSTISEIQTGKIWKDV